MMSVIHAPWGAFVMSTMTSTTPVITNPNPLMSRDRAMRRRASFAYSERSMRVQCRTIPSWEVVKEMNTPTM